jgi:PAS domain S-box-containing protein
MDIEGTLKADLIAPLHCWDIFSMHLAKMAMKGKKQAELSILEQYRDRYQWNINLEQVLDSSYEALVLTDSGVCIKWVSEGFTKMTGYQKKEAIGKSPKMLQGINTTRSSRDRVRQKLYGPNAFTENIVNYRKTGEEYICRVEIHPLFNNSNNLCHYLALEQEIK